MKVVVDNALGDGAVPPWLAWLPGVTNGREGLLAAAVIFGLLVQVAHQTVLMLHSRRYSRTGLLITRDVRQRLFLHLQGLNLRHHSKTPVGDSVYRLESDTVCFEKLLLGGIMPLVFFGPDAGGDVRRADQRQPLARPGLPRGRALSLRVDPVVGEADSSGS